MCDEHVLRKALEFEVKGRRKLLGATGLYVYPEIAWSPTLAQNYGT